jgi:hypothetical protein
MNFFAAHGVGCKPIPREPNQPTPDFVIELASEVICEVKQIVPNKEDRDDLSGEWRFTGRWTPDRLRSIFKNISRQLREASKAGTPTLLAIYDATPFQAYGDDLDVLQSMFGHLSVDVWEDATGALQQSEPYFGRNRTFTPNHNTSVSAVAMLRGGPEVETLSLALFHNPYARVPLDPRWFGRLPVSHKGR